ncbi:hypothetical protein COOONC_19708 [Cooperia oncophora]
MGFQLEAPKISNLSRDLANGVVLIRLIESLQGRKYYGKHYCMLKVSGGVHGAIHKVMIPAQDGIYEDDPTEIQMLLNVQMALDALREDGIKTVNIGQHQTHTWPDMVSDSTISNSITLDKIHTQKSLMMPSDQSALPEMKLTNFRTNWNDGRALSALLEYCQSGLCPEWRGLDPEKGLANCERALKLANEYLNIPPIISAAHLNSPHLDELSCITYLSYLYDEELVRYQATFATCSETGLIRLFFLTVSFLLPDNIIDGFETSWSDGYLFALLVEAVGGPVRFSITV